MAATSPFAGVCVFSDIRDNVVSIDTRGSRGIGMVLPAPAADADVYPIGEAVRQACRCGP